MPQPRLPTMSEVIGAHYPYDAKIIVGEETIEIHRSIVSMISPEFHKMFHQDTKEAKTGIIEINDFDAATVRNVLDFCYGRLDRKPSIEEIVGMVRFADKYDIKVIRKRFDADLADFINRNNFSMLGHYAAIKGKKQLLDDLIEFLREYPRLTVTSEFVDLPTEIRDAIMKAAAPF